LYLIFSFFKAENGILDRNVTGVQTCALPISKHHAPIVANAGGLGSFEPRKPKLENLRFYEDKGVEYMVKDPEKFAGKDIVIGGGGDSALDWTIYLSEKAKSLTLIHRRNEFRGALDSVQIGRAACRERWWGA